MARDRALRCDPPGLLEICAVFSDRPLRVRDLDAQLEQTGRWPEDLWRDCHRVTVAGPR